MSGSEDELQNKMSTLEMYKGKIESFSRNAEMLKISIDEHRRAKDTLENYKGTKASTEILIPIGGAAFVRAKTMDTKKGIMEIGNGVVFEEGIDKTLDRLERKMDELHRTEHEITDQIYQMEQAIAKLTQEVQTEYAELQGAGADQIGDE